jgi:hypothetical protein
MPTQSKSTDFPFGYNLPVPKVRENITDDVISFCPDCGRDLTELNKSPWADYIHIVPGGRPFWDVCVPPPTPEEIERMKPFVDLVVGQLAERLTETLGSILPYA